MVEAAGVEPASRKASATASTGVSHGLSSRSGSARGRPCPCQSQKI